MYQASLGHRAPVSLFLGFLCVALWAMPAIAQETGGVSKEWQCLPGTAPIGALAWDPTGTHLAVMSRDRAGAHLEVVEWPSLATRVVDAPGPSIDGGGIAIGPDGSVYWADVDATGPVLMSADATGAGSVLYRPTGSPRWLGQPQWTEHGLVTLANDSGPNSEADLLVTVGFDGSTSAEPVAGDPAYFLSVTPDGGTRMLTRVDDMFRTTSTVTTPDGESHDIEFSGPSVVVPTLAADGLRVLYSEDLGVRSRAIDGSDDRDEVGAEDLVNGAVASALGVIAAIIQEPFDTDFGPGATFDPELDGMELDGMERDRLCFATASWADPSMSLPPMPTAPPATPRPVLPEPGADAVGLGPLLPTSVDGHEIQYASESQGRERGLVRLTELFFPPLRSVADVLAVDADTVWAAMGIVAVGYPLDVVVITDPVGDGARWVQGMATVLTADGRLVAEPSQLGGRQVIAIRAAAGDEDGARWRDRVRSSRDFDSALAGQPPGALRVAVAGRDEACLEPRDGLRFVRPAVAPGPLVQESNHGDDIGTGWHVDGEHRARRTLASPALCPQPSDG